MGGNSSREAATTTAGSAEHPFQLTEADEAALGAAGGTQTLNAGGRGGGGAGEPEGGSEETVNLASCGLTTFPLDSLAAHESSATITTLVLNDNHIAEIPPALPALAGLTTLNLAHNDLTTVPPVLAALPTLSTLVLAHNAIDAFPDSLDFASATALTSLDCSHNGLADVATRFPPSLTHLSLAANRLAAYPATALAAATALTSLDVSHNHLAALSPAVALLSSLVVLDVSHNALAALPDALYQLTALEHVLASHNELNHLPPAPSALPLPALTALDLSHNALADASAVAWVVNAPALRTLRLNNNAFASFPPAFAALAKKLWSCDLTKQHPHAGAGSDGGAAASSSATPAAAIADPPPDVSPKAIDKLLTKLAKVAAATKPESGKRTKAVLACAQVLGAADADGRAQFIAGGGAAVLASLLTRVRSDDESGVEGAREVHEALHAALFAALSCPSGLAALLTLPLPPGVMPEFREMASKAATLQPSSRGPVVRADGTLRLRRKKKRSAASSHLQRVLTHLLLSLNTDSVLIKEMLFKLVRAVLLASLTPHVSSVVVLAFSATAVVRGHTVAARFKPVVTALLSRDSIALQESAMALLNTIVNAPAALDKRAALRAELVALGLNTVMEFLLACNVDSISAIIYAFEDDRAADEEDRALASRAARAESRSTAPSGAPSADDESDSGTYVDARSSPLKPRVGPGGSTMRRKRRRKRKKQTGGSADATDSGPPPLLISSSSSSSSSSSGSSSGSSSSYYSSSSGSSSSGSSSSSSEFLSFSSSITDSGDGKDNGSDGLVVPARKGVVAPKSAPASPVKPARPARGGRKFGSETGPGSSATMRRKRPLPPLPKRSIALSSASVEGKKAKRASLQPRSMSGLEDALSVIDGVVGGNDGGSGHEPASASGGTSGLLEVGGGGGGEVGGGEEEMAAVGVDVAIHHRLLRMSAFIGDASVIQIAASAETTGADVVASLLELNPLFDSAYGVNEYGLVVASWSEFADLASNPAEYPLVPLSEPVLDVLAAKRAGSGRKKKKKGRKGGDGADEPMLHLKLRPWELQVACEELPGVVGSYRVDPSDFCSDVTSYILYSSRMALEPLASDGRDGSGVEGRYSLHFVSDEGMELSLKDENVLKDYPQLLTLGGYGTLWLRAAPLVVRLEVGGVGATEVTLEIDGAETFGSVAARVGAMYELAAAAEYGIFVVMDGFETGFDGSETEGMWMDADAVVADFRSVLAESRVKFVRAPQEIEVSYGDVSVSVCLPLNVPVERLIGGLCRKVGVRDSDGFFLMRASAEAALALGGELTLAESGVVRGSKVVLKKRDDGTIPLARQAYINIWDEGGAVGEVYGDDGKLEAASLNKLVERLTDIEKLDLLFMDVFLYTHSSFVESAEVLRKLRERYSVPRDPSLGKKEFRQNIQIPLQLVVISVVKEWLKTHWDADNKEAEAELLVFVGELKRDGHGKQAEMVESLLRAAQDGVVRAPVLRLTRAEYDREHVFGREVAARADWREGVPTPRLPSSFVEELVLLDMDELEVARQITLRDFTVYASIEPSEFLGLKWTKPKYEHLAKHLLAFIGRFNLVSNWVSAHICRESSLRLRSKVMTFMIKLGSAFAELGNYSGTMAVIVGLSNAAVSRLKHTKHKVPARFKKQLAALESLMDMSGSFRTYRAKLAAASRAVPYVGVNLTDLVFLMDGNPDYVDAPGDGAGSGRLVNVDKVVMTHRVVAQVLWFQQRPYEFEIVGRIQQFLDRTEVEVSESDLFQLSLGVEPRGAEREELEP